MRESKNVQRPPGQRSLPLSQHLTRLPCLPPSSQPHARSVAASRPAPTRLSLAHPLGPASDLALIFRLDPIFMSMFTISNFPVPTERHSTQINHTLLLVKPTRQHPPIPTRPQAPSPSPHMRPWSQEGKKPESSDQRFLEPPSALFALLSSTPA